MPGTFSLNWPHARVPPPQPTGVFDVSYIWVGLGSALGGMARYGCSDLAVRYIGVGFPWATLFVNVAGSLLIGVLAGLAETRNLFGPGARLFLFVGVLGGFTTFSAITNDTLTLLRNAAYLSAAANVLLTVALGLAAVAVGYAAARAL